MNLFQVYDDPLQVSFLGVLILLLVRIRFEKKNFVNKMIFFFRNMFFIKKFFYGGEIISIIIW